MQCKLIIYKGKINTIFTNKIVPNVRFKGNNFNSFGVEFIINADRHDEYLDIPYAQIPNIIKYHQEYASEAGICSIELELGKKQFANIMNYYDKSLPKTVMNNKKQGIIYKI